MSTERIGAVDSRAMPAGELALLRKGLEKRERGRLWVNEPFFTFTPRVLPLVYGDGRALFALSTINQRPAYWIIRACSETEFGEFTDEILTDLEGEFGNARCWHSDNSLFQPRRYRMQYCKCEDCSAPGRARWPMVDGCGGCAWGRMRWPAGFKTEPDGYMLSPKPWYLYLLECRNGAWYAGITTDVQRRFHAHAAGRGARYTRANPPVRLVGSRPFPDRSSAAVAEWQIKQLPRDRKQAFLRARA